MNSFWEATKAAHLCLSMVMKLLRAPILMRTCAVVRSVLSSFIPKYCLCNKFGLMPTTRRQLEQSSSTLSGGSRVLSQGSLSIMSDIQEANIREYIPIAESSCKLELRKTAIQFAQIVNADVKTKEREFSSKMNILRGWVFETLLNQQNCVVRTKTKTNLLLSSLELCYSIKNIR